METKMSLRAVVEAGILIALAAVLSMIKVYHAPQGGSVTAGSMVPVIIVALRWGPKIGVLAGIAYGFVQQLIEPYIVHPVQMLLDYQVAFGVLGLAGFFRKSPAIGAAIGIAGRFVSHVAAGVVFFASYAPAGTSPLVYSLAYNASYLVPEVVISAVVIYVLAATQVLRVGLRAVGRLPE